MTAPATVIAGWPFDAIHAASNLVCGILIAPLVAILIRLNKFNFGRN